MKFSEYLSCFPLMENVEAACNDALGISFFAVLIIQRTRRYVPDITSRLR